jgi:hypothetical protein
MQTIPIIHVYGQIGYLPWQEKNHFRTYEPIKQDEMTLLTIKESSEGIKIIHEEHAEDDPAFKQARGLLGKADKIIFLGFGYHDQNLKRLGIENISKNNSSHVLVSIIGSAYHLTNNQRNQIFRKSKERISFQFDNIENQTIKDFF